LAWTDLDNPEIRETMGGWLALETALRPFTSADINLAFGQSHRDILTGLERLKPLVVSDPFLRSCLAERIFYNSMADSNPTLGLEALQQAITKGYPSANLYNDLGVLWFTQGDYAKARQAFEAALRSPLNHTTALENLRRTPGS
jgi:Tfp pilus assembly protein PilF